MGENCPSTIIKLPDGLLDHLITYSPGQCRRWIYVYDNEHLMPVPGRDYGLDVERGEITIYHGLGELDTITVAIPTGDERWLYTPTKGWERL